MKFNKLKFLILILFILPQYTLSYDKLEYYLYCNQIPEGNPFGLIFKDNEVWAHPEESSLFHGFL